MKKKLIILSLIIMFFGGQLLAQGIFGSSFEKGEEAAQGSPVGAFRAGPPINPGGPGEEWDNGDSPVGEGLLILSALAGGYALVRNRKSKTLRKAH